MLAGVLHASQDARLLAHEHCSQMRGFWCRLWLFTGLRLGVQLSEA